MTYKTRTIQSEYHPTTTEANTGSEVESRELLLVCTRRGILDVEHESRVCSTLWASCSIDEIPVRSSGGGLFSANRHLPEPNVPEDAASFGRVNACCRRSRSSNLRKSLILKSGELVDGGVSYVCMFFTLAPPPLAWHKPIASAPLPFLCIRVELWFHKKSPF